MADLEDANSPTWGNVVGGQVNLMDAVGRDDRVHRAGRQGVRARTTTLADARSCGRAAGTCPSGTSLVDGEPVSASLFDFGLYVFHNAARQLDARQRAVLLPAQAREPPRGAAVERRLRPRRGRARPARGHDPRHRAHRDDPRRVRDGRDPVRAARPLGRAQRRPLGLHLQRHQELPRRGPSSSCRTAAQVTMTVPFMRAYTELLVQTCHRRGAHAMGGMAAFIPSRRDPEANATRAGQGAGRQGTRGRRRLRRHLGRAPRSGPDAREAFDAVLGERPNQLERLRDDVRVTAARPARRRRTPGRGDRGRAPGQRRGRRPLPRVVARRQRARRRSTTSWRTPRPPRSRARRSGSGSATAGSRASTPRRCSARSSTASAPSSTPGGRAVRRDRARRRAAGVPHARGVTSI